jgi:hypothetical protein
VVLCADETRRADPLVPLANVLGRVIAIDGAPYRPSPGTRFHAAAGWFRTAFQWCAGRCLPRRLRA